MKEWTNEEVQDMLSKVFRRAAVDPAFRALALRDAAAAIREVTSKPLPASIVYKFVDNSGTTKTIPLPDLASDDLADSELENVAGGSNPPPPPPPIAGGWSKIAPLQRLAKKAK